MKIKDHATPKWYCVFRNARGLIVGIDGPMTRKSCEKTPAPPGTRKEITDECHIEEFCYGDND